jgi:hypothetical protein
MRNLSLASRNKISHLQQAIWKTEEVIKLASADESSSTFIHARAIIDILEKQIEEIWNGN